MNGYCRRSGATGEQQTESLESNSAAASREYWPPSSGQAHSNNTRTQSAVRQHHARRSSSAGLRRTRVAESDEGRACERAIFCVTGVTASTVAQSYGWSAGRLTKPTNLGEVSARKRKAQVLPPIEMTILLVCVIIFLSLLTLLFFDQSFLRAAIEMWGRL
jgi:hypothetical protein